MSRNKADTDGGWEGKVRRGLQVIYNVIVLPDPLALRARESFVTGGARGTPYRFYGKSYLHCCYTKRYKCAFSATLPAREITRQMYNTARNSPPLPPHPNRSTIPLTKVM